MVEAAIFLPWDDGGFPVAHLRDAPRSRVPGEVPPTTLVLGWVEDGEGKPHYSEVAIWERRFLRAELSFTGDADESLAEIDEPHGHNIFLKIYSEGWIVDLISYV